MLYEVITPSGEDLVREDLAACYRLAAHYGWDDLVATHISGSAANGVDYQVIPNSVIIPAGRHTTRIQIAPSYNFV